MFEGKTEEEKLKVEGECRLNIKPLRMPQFIRVCAIFTPSLSLIKSTGDAVASFHFHFHETLFSVTCTIRVIS